MSTSSAPFISDLSSPEKLRPLRLSLSPEAQLVLPSDALYAELTTPWNLDMVRSVPLVIWVTCTADVVASINFIRQRRLPFTVGSGFHSRYSLRDGHVLIHLGGMRKVSVNSTAAVARLQGGARNGDLDHECSKHHLYVTAGTYPGTGCGGLILGGGVGYLSRRLGLTIDSLLEVEIVTAAGEVRRASNTENIDLFWAVRGAGFNFGVVTEFVLQLHPIGHVLRSLSAADEAIASKYGIQPQAEVEHLMVHGMLQYPQAAFPHIMQMLDEHYVQAGRDGPLKDRNLVLGVVLTGVSLVHFTYCGDVYDGFRALERLVETIGPPMSPVVQTIHVSSYLSLQHAIDPFATPGHYYERAWVAQSTPLKLADRSLELLQRVPPGLEQSALVFHLYGVGGALTDHMDKGAFSGEQRKGNWFIVAMAHYNPDKCSKDTALKWANTARDIIVPYCSSAYTNSSNGQPGSRIIYAGSLDELRVIKQRYDPSNFFRNNQNVVPANMDESAQEMAQTRD